jgi:hypothetical protein
MEFDFKVTIWERVTVPEKDEQRVLEAIKSGKVTSAEDIFQMGIAADCDKQHDTDEQMTPQENGGCSTIEVMEDGETIFDNSID